MSKASSKFEGFLVKLKNGTLTYLEASSSFLEPAQRQALLNGMAQQAASGTGGGGGNTHPVESADQNTPPTGVWATLTIQPVISLTINGLEVGAGTTFTIQADVGRTVAVPTISAGDYAWTGLRA